MIMYSNKITFPAKHSAQWAEFVRLALEKKPHLRPSAAALLDHPWIGCVAFAAMQHQRWVHRCWLRIQAIQTHAVLSPLTGSSSYLSTSMVASYLCQYVLK